VCSFTETACRLFTSHKHTITSPKSKNCVAVALARIHTHTHKCTHSLSHTLTHTGDMSSHADVHPDTSGMSEHAVHVARQASSSSHNGSGPLTLMQQMREQLRRSQPGESDKVANSSCGGVQQGEECGVDREESIEVLEGDGGVEGEGGSEGDVGAFQGGGELEVGEERGGEEHEGGAGYYKSKGEDGVEGGVGGEGGSSNASGPGVGVSEGRGSLAFAVSALRSQMGADQGEGAEAQQALGGLRVEGGTGGCEGGMSVNKTPVQGCSEGKGGRGEGGGGRGGGDDSGCGGGEGGDGEGASGGERGGTRREGEAQLPPIGSTASVEDYQAGVLSGCPRQGEI